MPSMPAEAIVEALEVPDGLDVNHPCANTSEIRSTPLKLGKIVDWQSLSFHVKAAPPSAVTPHESS